MPDVLLTIAAGLTQLLLGGMGVYVSLRPPTQRHHKHWLFAFVAIGITGLAITAWAAKRGAESQSKAGHDIHEAQVAATNANTAATNANNAATAAQRETEAARAEARIAEHTLERLINERSRETNQTITKWQSNTETAVGKILRPPRTLTLQQKRTIVAILRSWGSTEISVRHSQGNDESQQYSDQLSEAIKEAGWKVKPRPKFLIALHETYGVWVMIHDAKNVPPAADKLVEALSAAGISVKGTAVDAIDPGSVEIMVGLQ